MPRYVVERLFPDGLNIPINADGEKAVSSVVANNEDQNVTWIHSYVTEDRKKTFCIYDGPDPDAVKRVAERNKLPVEKITRVSVLDPYFYR